MKLIKFYDPVQTSFHCENGFDTFESLSRHFSPEESHFSSRRTLPRTNISEDDQAYRIEMALPGVDKKDIKIDHDNGVLKVRVDAHTKKDEAQLPYAVREFNYADASRTFRIGDKVDAGRISASYKQGLLVLLLPKKDEFIPKPARSISVE